jgi:uncharacterized protein YjbJ (UPF0337 family)
MNEADEIKNKAQGKLREVKGAATGDTGEEMKGKLQGAKGDVQGAINQRRREDLREHAEREGERRTP